MSSLKATYNTQWMKAEWLLGGFITFNTNVAAKADNDEWTVILDLVYIEKLETD